MFAPRLIHPSVAVIRRLDAAATWGVDPPGDPTTGFDKVFKESIRYDSGGAALDALRYKTEIEVKCQVEQESFESLVATFGGDSPVTDSVLILHRRHLLRAGLIDSATGAVDIPKGSIVDKVYHPRTLEVLASFDREFVYEVRPRSWGYRGRMNIYVVYLYKRERLGEL